MPLISLTADNDGKAITSIGAGNTYKIDADLQGICPATVSKRIIENEKQPIQKLLLN